MTPGLIARHHDYVIGPNQDARLASVDPGQLIEGIALSLDPDAPFVMRSRAVRVSYGGGRLQFDLQHLLMRWAGPDRDYRSQNLIRQSLFGPYFGQLGMPIPVSPEVVYPRNGEITVDILNDGTEAITNLTLYFRGVKLFSPGAVRSYGYPSRFASFPFTYAQGRYSDTDGLTLVRDVAVTQGPLRQTFQCKGDADFVIRGGQAGSPFSQTPVYEVFVTMRDEDEKPYSNDAVHIDVLFGNSGFGGTYIFGFNEPAPVAGGPNSPGLFYPEIYVPKNHLLYMDVSRSDSSYGGADVVDIPISFLGHKVFQK